MRALRLDFQRVRQPLPWLGLAVLLLAAASFAVMVGHYRTVEQQIGYWQAKVDKLERQSSLRQAPALSPQAAREQLQEVKQANQVVRQLALPWNTLFKAVETSASKDVALLSMEPDLNKGTVLISGEAKDLEAVLGYVKQLSKQEVFGRVLLQNHRVQQNDPEKPVRFALIAQCKELAP